MKRKIKLPAFLIILILLLLDYGPSHAFMSCDRNECHKLFSSAPAGNFKKNNLNLDNSNIPVLNPDNQDKSINDSEITKDCNDTSAEFDAYKQKKLVELKKIKNVMTNILEIAKTIKVLEDRVFFAMRRTRVCTGNGYKEEVYDISHSISDIIDSLQDLKNNTISNNLFITNEKFQDGDCIGDLEQNLQNKKSIVDEYEQHIKDSWNNFKLEIANLFIRVESFINTVQTLAEAHKTDIPGIMAECPVSAVKAARMRKARLRVLFRFNILKTKYPILKTQINNLINRINI
jgi:hypothetical protein